MVKTLLDWYVVFYVMGAVGIIGILSKVISNITLKRLLKASGNMAKSNHKLMRLVRAKFEHACMVSDKVENIEVFVEKYIHEYNAFGVKLHSWKRLGKLSIWLCGIAAAAGMGGSYVTYGVGEDLITYGIAGIAGMAVLFLSYQSADEGYKLKVIKVYMVDYLENVCAHRYAKIYSKEGQAAPLANAVPAEMSLEAFSGSEEFKRPSIPAEMAGLDKWQPEPIQPESMQPKPIQPEPIQKKTMRPAPIQNGMALKEVVQEGKVQSETIQPEIGQPEKVGPDIPQSPIMEPTPEMPAVPQEKPQEPIKAEETTATVEQMPRETMIREILEEFLA